MSRRVRRNALVEASEPHQKERLGLLSVNEKDLGTVKRPSTRLLAKRLLAPGFWLLTPSSRAVAGLRFVSAICYSRSARLRGRLGVG